MSFLATEIAAAINTFFKKSNGKGLVTEEQILNYIGLGGLTISGGAALVKIAANFNTIRTSLRNIGDMFTWLGKTQPFQDLSFYVKYYNSNLWTTVSRLSVVDKLGKRISKEYGLKWNPTADVPIWKTALAIAAVIAAIEACKLAFHGLRQLSGKEAQYMRSDVQTMGDALEAFFTDSQFRAQALMYVMATLGRGMVTFFMTIVRTIVGVVSGLLWLVAQPIKQIAALVYEFLAMIDKKNAAVYKKANDMVVAYTDALGETAKQSFSDIPKSWAEITDFTLGDQWIDGAKENGYQVGKGYVDGTIEGIDNYANAVNKKLTEDDQKILDRWKSFWQINSPSKVTKYLYMNIVKGCAVGIESNSKQVKNALKKLNKEELAVATDGAKAIEETTKAIINNAYGNFDKDNWVDYGKVDTLRDTKMTIDDSGANEGKKKEVMLNRELLEVLIDQKDAVQGKTKADAAQFLLSQAATKGIETNAQEAVDLINAVYTLQDDKTKVTLAGIEKLNNNTAASVADIADTETTAMSMVVDDTMQKYTEIMNLTKDHQSELVGKKKEEVKEFLKQEAIKRNMTEEAAEEAATAATEQLFAGTKANAVLTQTELTNKLNVYDQDYKAYVKLEEEKNKVLQKAIEARSKMESTNEDLKLKLAAGKITPQEYVNQMKQVVDPYNSLMGAYKKIVEQQAADIKKMGLKNDKTMDKALKEAENLINKNKSNKRGSFASLVDKFKEMLGLGAGDVDPKTWKLPGDGNTGNKNKNKDKDKDNKKKAVDAAKKTKQDLEKNRADLTPTFDLDKLSDEAKKANGIVMSSLMAAQNASIGDYINKDSELNPFMKDRWQNVYNFTQNNYSPKALSRIDIYRQTQRQISMSRGF